MERPPCATRTVRKVCLGHIEVAGRADVWSVPAVTHGDSFHTQVPRDEWARAGIQGCPPYAREGGVLTELDHEALQGCRGADGPVPGSVRVLGISFRQVVVGPLIVGTQHLLYVGDTQFPWRLHRKCADIFRFSFEDDPQGVLMSHHVAGLVLLRVLVREGEVKIAVISFFGGSVPSSLDGVGD